MSELTNGRKKREFLKSLLVYTLKRFTCNQRGSTVRPNSMFGSKAGNGGHARYDESIVLTGISGRFPKAANMAEFQRNLLTGVDMTTETKKRWNCKGLQGRMGLLNCLDKFDSSFFNLTPLQADQLDPQARMLMEASFEAILDAGYNPSELTGHRTAVFCGALGGEALDYGNFRHNRELSGYSIISWSNFIIPGRIAFVLDFQGPSAHVSSGCSSGLTAIETAVNHIRLGTIDAAIVTGSNIMLNPRIHDSFTSMGVLAMDGHCKVFDESADGFVRAEVAVAILLQRQELARRSYGRIMHVRTGTDGFKHAGLTHPSGQRQEELFRITYEEAKIDPACMSYVEAHGTGTPIGDPEELGSISRAYCNNCKRKAPLLIGSVKSNMGHGESGAAMASLAKIVVAIQTGIIPGNLHFKAPRAELKSLMDEGKLKVVSDNTPFDGGLIGINSFGLSGTNSHLILKPGRTNLHECGDSKLTKLPVILPLAGRTEDMLCESLKEANAYAYNPDYRYLVQSAFGKAIPGLHYRGYSFFSPGEESTDPKIAIKHCDGTRPRFWILFPEADIRWVEITTELMSIQTFAESFERSRTTVKNVTGLDLEELIRIKNSSIRNNIHHALLVTTAIQIALWDTLKQALRNENSDGFIGHSHGELLCGLADGCLTSEETLLLTDAKGRALRDGRKEAGAMAAISLSAEEIQTRLPSDVEVACVESRNSVTISGGAEAVTQFIKLLKKEGVAAEVIPSYDIAFNSRLITQAAGLFLKYADGILPRGHERLKRSSSWVSTFISAENDLAGAVPPWGDYASVEYLHHGMQLPVRLHQALKQVPAGSIMIELPPRTGHHVHAAGDCLSHLYRTVGDLYNAGLDVDMTKLYPHVSLPVSADTPFVSTLIKWRHSESWKTHVMSYPLDTTYEIAVDLQSPPHAAIEGHKVEDSIVYPATGYIFIAWTHFADVLGMEWESTPVILQNVKFHRPTVLNKDQPTRLLFSLFTASGKFELKSENTVIASGSLEVLQDKEDATTLAIVHDQSSSRSCEQKPTCTSAGWLPLKTPDIYKELRLRGLNYTGDFQGIQRMDNEGKWAEVLWSGNWISFLDTLLQASALNANSRNLVLPVEIEKFEINPVKFFQHLRKSTEGSVVRVDFNPTQCTISCPGVRVKFPILVPVARTNETSENLVHEKWGFFPFFAEGACLDKQRCSREMINLALENIRSRRLLVADVFTKSDNSVSKLFVEIWNQNTQQTVP